jgi:hypothetical protein
MSLGQFSKLQKFTSDNSVHVQGAVKTIFVSVFHTKESLLCKERSSSNPTFPSPITQKFHYKKDHHQPTPHALLTLSRVSHLHISHLRNMSITCPFHADMILISSNNNNNDVLNIIHKTLRVSLICKTNNESIGHPSRPLRFRTASSKQSFRNALHPTPRIHRSCNPQSFP